MAIERSRQRVKSGRDSAGRSALSGSFDLDCVACSRLARFLAKVRGEHPDYHARPVPSFGDARAALLVVGLAPGMHGANRTGRPFTGDYAGILLYRTLRKFGFANHDGSDDPGDGLRLTGCRVTNAVKCLPPQNKPAPAEVRRCNGFLAAELAAVQPRVVLALGAVAHRAVLMALDVRASEYPFRHHAVCDIPAGENGRKSVRLFSSYHCSRYNTNTKRLSTGMFEAVFCDIQAFLTRSP